LAVRTKSKSSRVARPIEALAGIQKKSMPMIPVEGPKLIKETLILQVFGILFHSQRPVGRYKSVIHTEFEAGPGPVGTRRRHRGDVK
jgi:hypothetical protein